MPALKSHFLLDPNVIYLNHGSFGACPRPVFAAYQRWQRQLERQPVEFLGRRAHDLLAQARAALAAYLGCPAERLVFYTNPTSAMNAVARALPLRPGDEILTTDQEYGAMDKMWDFICAKIGAVCVRRPIPLPVAEQTAFVEDLWAGVTERTRVLFLSHITSPTALIFPLAELCRRARAAGILTLIDGAHAPGQLPLNLTDLDPDVYTGTCHKWLCAPKGSAFLYAGPAAQPWLEPLIVSFGWGEVYPSPAEQFIGYHEWQGTRDIAAFLSVPAAIQFQAEHDWPRVRARCHELLRQARRQLTQLTGLPPLCPDSPAWYAQMAAFPLPACDGAALQRQLYDERRIEVPIIAWGGRPFVRVSVQGYNTEADVEALARALETLLPRQIRCLAIGDSK